MLAARLRLTGKQYMWAKYTTRQEQQINGYSYSWGTSIDQGGGNGGLAGASTYSFDSSTGIFSGSNYTSYVLPNTGTVYNPAGSWMSAMTLTADGHLWNQVATAFAVYIYYTVRNAFQCYVSSSNPNAYPVNGRHVDGYWYIKL